MVSDMTDVTEENLRAYREEAEATRDEPPPPDAATRLSDYREDPDQFIELGRVDWFVTKTWKMLHAVPDFDAEQREYIAENWGVKGPVKLACGRTAAEVYIPGMFTRMGAMRCKGCCRAMGFPPGKGSPKNDAECRKILGLDDGKR